MTTFSVPVQSDEIQYSSFTMNNGNVSEMIVSLFTENAGKE